MFYVSNMMVKIRVSGLSEKRGKVETPLRTNWRQLSHRCQQFIVLLFSFRIILSACYLFNIFGDLKCDFECFYRLRLISFY